MYNGYCVYFATNPTAFNFPSAKVKAATTFLAPTPVKTVSLYNKRAENHFPNYVRTYLPAQSKPALRSFRMHEESCLSLSQPRYQAINVNSYVTNVPALQKTSSSEGNSPE